MFAAALIPLWLSGAAAVPAPPLKADRPWADLVSPLVKVRPGQALEGAPAWEWVAARGECQGLQVRVRAGLQGVRIQLPALRSNGHSLTARLYREEFVPVSTPSNTQGAPGLWPDPLLPEPSGGSVPAADSTAARPLVFYAELCVPAGQPPGTYTGELRLTAAHAPAVALPVRAEVEPFALPPTSSLPNSFGLSLYSLARGHHLDPASQEARTLLHAYAVMALEHRLSLHGMSMQPPPATFGPGGAKVDFTEYDRELGPFLDGTAVPSGARFTTTNFRDPPQAVTAAQQDPYARAFREHFQQKGWPATLFFYAKDEPKPADIPLVLGQAQRLHRVPGIPVLVTSPFDPRWVGAADILCPTLNCFFPRPGPQTCRTVQPLSELRQRLGAGAAVWWYQSCNVQGCTGGPAGDPKIDEVYSGWPSYMVDHPGPLNRAMGALAFLEGIDGELYYDTVQAFNHQDPWEGVFAFGGNGDGTLFYPGTPARIGGATHAPVASLRLKHIRDGLQDFEYLKLWSAGGHGVEARASARVLVRSGYDIERDPAAWDHFHRTLAREIARLPGAGKANK